jgi:molybdate transport system regulatory protein
MLQVKSKVWLEKNGKLVFGTGKYLILKTIAETGSINQAAKVLNMSYRHIWSYASSIEKRLSYPLLAKNKGGRNGGGAVLTDSARELLEKYEKLDQEVKAFADKRFKEIFKV